MAVPPLIDRETFDCVQGRLKSRGPMVTPARVSSGPTLLTGICFCAKSWGAMTLRTGKGSAGGMHRYYTCSTKARQGKTGCKGRSIPMDKLDHLVADHLEERLLQPERLTTILSNLLGRRHERTERRREHPAELHRRITETDQRLNRLYHAIESGVAALDDIGLKDRIAGLTAIRDQATSNAERTQATLDHTGNQSITVDMIDTLADAARAGLRSEGGGYRRDHLRAFAQRVEVADDELRIVGIEIGTAAKPRCRFQRWIGGNRHLQFCTEVARLDGETSNNLIEVLADWSSYLEHRESYNQQVTSAQQSDTIEPAVSRPAFIHAPPKSIKRKLLPEPSP